MVLYMIGLGLGDENDITLKGLKIVQSADMVYLEAYTSVFDSTMIDPTKLQVAYNLSNPIIIADRSFVEDHADEYLVVPAKTQSIVLLVVGDPICATTHIDLLLRCRQQNIVFEMIHNASIYNVAGACGLQLYNFGQTISIPFCSSTTDTDNNNNSPPTTSYYHKIQYNRRGNLHTLCLLDIKVKEPDYLSVLRKGSNTSTSSHNGQITEYLPPRYMTVCDAVQQLIDLEERICCEQVYDPNKTLCVGLLRMGQISQQIIVGTLYEILYYGDDKCGLPLHSLIITGNHLHDLEIEFLQAYKIGNNGFPPSSISETTES